MNRLHWICKTGKHNVLFTSLIANEEKPQLKEIHVKHENRPTGEKLSNNQ